MATGGSGGNVTYRINVTGAQQLNQATQSVANFTTTVNASNKQLNSTKQAGFAGAQGLLALSQAADDVQYGFRGIVNNIPGLVMGFGAGAGFAGAVQIAAIGVNTLINNMDGLTRSMGTLFGETKKTTAELKTLEAEAEKRKGVEGRLEEKTEPPAKFAARDALLEAMKAVGGSGEVLKSFREKIFDELTKIGDDMLGPAANALRRRVGGLGGVIDEAMRARTKKAFENRDAAVKQAGSIFEAIEKGDVEAIKKLLATDTELIGQLKVEYERLLKAVNDPAKKIEADRKAALDRLKADSQKHQDILDQQVDAEAEAARKRQEIHQKEMKLEDEKTQKAAKEIAGRTSIDDRIRGAMLQAELMGPQPGESVRQGQAAERALIGGIDPRTGRMIRTPGQAHALRQFLGSEQAVEEQLTRETARELFMKHGVRPEDATGIAEQMVKGARGETDLAIRNDSNKLLQENNQTMTDLIQALKNARLFITRRR